MRQNKIKTIIVNLDNLPNLVPLNAGYLKSYVMADNDLSSQVDIGIHTILLADYDLNDLYDQVISLLEPGCDILGVGYYLWNANIINDLVPLIKDKYPDIKIILGGEEADAEVYKRNIPVDVVVYKEGEVAFKALLRHYLEFGEFKLEQLRSINNLIFKDQDEVVATPVQEIEDLNMIPSPYLNGILELTPDSYAILEITRGCPFKCSFCSESSRFKKVKEFDLARIFKELAFILKNTKHLQIVDNNFNIDKVRIKKLGQYLGFLQQQGLIRDDFCIDVELNSSLLDAETVKYLKMARVLDVSFGIQTLNPEAYPTLRRWRMDKAMLAEKLQYFDNDFVVMIELILGLPNDDLQTFIDNIFYIYQKYQHLRLDFNIERLKVIKNTAYRVESEQYGFKYNQNPPYQLESSDSWTADDLNRGEVLCNYLVKEMAPENYRN